VTPAGFRGERTLILSRQPSPAPDPLTPKGTSPMKKYLRHPFLIVCARVVFGGFLTAIGFELGGDFMNVIFPPKA